VAVEEERNFVPGVHTAAFGEESSATEERAQAAARPVDVEEP